MVLQAITINQQNGMRTEINFSPCVFILNYFPNINLKLKSLGGVSGTSSRSDFLLDSADGICQEAK